MKVKEERCREVGLPTGDGVVGVAACTGASNYYYIHI
jgi:hypothetical protein